MASSPAPNTPDNAPRRTFMSRSVTAPIRTSPATAKPPPEIGATEGVETLYTHPNASIVKFTTAGSRPGSSSPSRQQGSVLLPWTSTTERTVAAGPLSVYRVPGSVSFLNSGNLLHAILPRSQCWCVDGVSKFALRVLPDTYYRIELPGDTAEDREEVERLKLTLQKVCFYERTPCPFDRGFDVTIEDEAELEVRKKRRKSHGPAKKWKLDRAHSWKPEGWQPDARTGSGDEASGLGSSAGSDEDESEDVSGREDSEAEEKTRKLAERASELKITTPSRVRTARTLLEQRSVTAPAAQLTLQSPPPSRLRTRVDVDGTVEVVQPAALEGACERDEARLRTFQAIPTDMPPSPPDSSAGLDHGELRRESSTQELLPQYSAEDEVVTTNSIEGELHAAEGAEYEGEDTLIMHEQGSRCDQPTGPRDREQDAHSHDIPLDETPVTPVIDTRDVETTSTGRDSAPVGSEYQSSIPQDVTASSRQRSRDQVEAEHRPSTPQDKTVLSQRRQSDPFITDPAPQPTPSRSRSPSKSPTKSQPHPDDPFAAIQARILARRSIGGTTSFHPPQPPPTRRSTSSSSSNATASSTLSRRSHSSSRQRQAFATAMVKKACSVFLGPPAHLVAIMLRIAARFAKGAFGVDSVFYVESPAGTKGRVPGSYQVFANGKVDGEGLNETGEEDDWEEDEDDFGVPLRSPVRLASLSSLRSGSGSGSGEGLRERGGRDRGWDVD